MSHWLLIVGGAVVGLVVPRLRRRAQRGLYGDDVFEASVEPLTPSPPGVSRARRNSAGAVVTDDGDLRWRSEVLSGGRLADATGGAGN